MTNEQKTKEERERRELEHFDKLATDEGYIWWGGRTPAAKLRFERRKDLLKKHLDFKPEDKILECGCGSGDFTKYICESVGDIDLSIYALEISKDQIQFAKQKINDPRVSFVTGSITELPFKDNHFKYILGNSILHHLDLNIALKEIFRVLAPGGRLMFFEPNLLNPIGWLLFKVKPFRKLHGASPDEMAFCRWELIKKLQENKFIEVEVKPFDFMFPLIPEKLFGLTKKVEKVFEKTIINEIAGSLIVKASK